MSRDRGSITIWMLGLSLLLLVFGGLSLDYWRALGAQRELAAVADSAALAGASGVDEPRYRETGDLVIDPMRAEDLVTESVELQGVEVTAITVEADAGSVTVTLTASVDLGLLGVFVDDDTPFTVRAIATALPIVVP